MKRSIIAILAVIALPFVASAQDDLYFTPSKAQLKAEKQKRAEERAAREAALLERDSQPAEYYSGINKTDDEYNRRIKTTRNKIYTVNEKDIHSTDSIASDIIEFTAEKGVYPSDHNVADTVYKYIYVNDEDDYVYSRYMSRWEDFYWWHHGFGPWGWYYPLSWYAGWYGPWYNPWIDPWFNPWFEPWFDPWFYDPWYYRHYYGWYRPWGGWYSPGYYPGGGGGGGGHHGNYYANRHGGAPTGTANHAGAIRNHNFLADNSRGSSSRISNNDIARRNGDSPAAYTYGRTRASGLRFGGDRNSSQSYYPNPSASSRFSGNRSSYSGSSSNSGSSGSSYSGSRSSSSGSSYSGSRSSGYSGGGGGGGFSGGHSGGGSSHSGGGGGGGVRFGGGRR